MKIIKYNLDIRKIDNSVINLTDLSLKELKIIVEDFIKNEYNLLCEISYIKLYDIMRKKTKNTFLTQIIKKIEKKQYDPNGIIVN